MLWSFNYKNQTYVSWGKPSRFDATDLSDCNPMPDYQLYKGETPADNLIWLGQGISALGVGDCIWLMTYLRDIWRIKMRR